MVEVPIVQPQTGLTGTTRFGSPTSAEVGRIEDLDGDGKQELIAIHASWELRALAFSHAESPAGYFVLAWDGMAYRDASNLYLRLFDEKIAEAEKRLQQARTANQNLDK